MHMYDERGLFCDWPTAADGAYLGLPLFLGGGVDDTLLDWLLQGQSPTCSDFEETYTLYLPTFLFFFSQHTLHPFESHMSPQQDSNAV